MTAERRLSAARQALLGERPPRRRPEINDDIALFHIVAEQMKPEMDVLRRALTSRMQGEALDQWQAEVDREPDSVRTAAIKQAANARRNPKQDPKAVAERLRRKAGTAPMTSQDMADVEGLIHGNSWKAELIEELIEGLKRLGIKAADRLAQ